MNGFRDRLRNHFTYSLWKYALLVIVSVGGWNLIYSATAYKPPPDKKIDTYIVGGVFATDTEQSLAELAAPAFPDMESVEFRPIVMETQDDYYATLQLSTYIGAQEGDVYLMDPERFKLYAEAGLFIPLDDLFGDGLFGDARQGVYTYDDDTQKVTAAYGVSMEKLYGLLDIGIDNRNMWMGVTAYSKNQDNAIKMMQWFVSTFMKEKPDWLIESEANMGNDLNGAEEEVLPSY